jgi:hypothetical protein
MFSLKYIRFGLAFLRKVCCVKNSSQLYIFKPGVTFIVRKMKKLFISLLIVATLLGIAGFVVYKFYMADLIADAVVSNEDVPAFVPEKIKTKINKYKTPINYGAEEVIKKMHDSKITIEQILKAIDEVPEEQAYSMLEELKTTKIRSSDQVFDMAKKHFPVDFDVEVFRKPFNEKADIGTLRKGISYIKEHQESMDIEMAKAVAKKILLQKEKEYNKIMGYK